MKIADRVFANDRHWREAKPDERRMILEEYVTDLRKREEVSGLSGQMVVLTKTDLRP